MIVWALRIENRARLTHFLIKNVAIIGNYLSVDNMDEVFICTKYFVHLSVITSTNIYISAALANYLQQQKRAEASALEK